MRRFVTFLKKLVNSTDPQRIPATYSEMTLHDALRICAGGVQDGGRSDVPPATLRQIDICWYSSESDLPGVWNCFSDTHRQTANLTVILVLGNFLRGNLRELIRRRRRARRLVIVPQAGHWPGLDSFADLVLASGSLAWNSIELCRDLRDALHGCVAGCGPYERLLVVLPASQPVGDGR